MVVLRMSSRNALVGGKRRRTTDEHRTNRKNERMYARLLELQCKLLEQRKKQGKYD